MMHGAAEFGMASLLPAIATIIVATLWRRVSVAMACGVGVAALVASRLNPVSAAKSLWSLLAAAITDFERLKIVVFVLLVGGLIEIVATSGAYDAFAEALGRSITTARRTRIAIWLLSCCLFFDDYANVLISGSSMRSIAQRRGVRPAMLAYIVDVVAVLASVMLVSTWAAFEQGTMLDAARSIGLRQSPGDLFLASLPYHFYTYLAVLLALAVAVTGKWFGSSIDTREFTREQKHCPSSLDARPGHVIAPFLLLIVAAIAGIAISGFWRVHQSGAQMNIFAVLSASAAVDSLIVATLLAIALAAYLFKKDGVLGRRHMGRAWTRGVRDMLEIGLIILLARSLSEGTMHLGAGTYLAETFTRVLNPALFPAAMFTLAMLVTVATGFSWGSMAIVMPVAFSFASATGSTQLVSALSAAVITGAVSGEHLIPYSEKAVLTAASCGITATYHFKTQALQSVVAFACALLGFTLLGFGAPLWTCYVAALAALLATHFSMARAPRESSARKFVHHAG